MVINPLLTSKRPPQSASGKLQPRGGMVTGDRIEKVPACYDVLSVAIPVASVSRREPETTQKENFHSGIRRSPNVVASSD